MGPEDQMTLGVMLVLFGAHFLMSSLDSDVCCTKFEHSMLEFH